MTPRELRDEIASFGMRRKDDEIHALVLAWHVANYGNAAFGGTLPDLAVVLKRFGSQTRDPRELRLEGQLLAERMGVPVRPISEAAKRALLNLNRES